MVEVYWTGGLARARGSKAVEAYIHTPGAMGREFFEALREGRWLATECGEKLHLPPRLPCPDGRRPRGHRVVDVEEWVVVTATRVETGVVYAFLRPLPLGGLEVEGGIIHRLCNAGGPGDAIGRKARPRWRPVGERRGSLNDIECFEASG